MSNRTLSRRVAESCSPNDLVTPGEPTVYGDVVAEFGAISVRHDGSVYSVWEGPKLLLTTHDADELERFAPEPLQLISRS